MMCNGFEIDEYDHRQVQFPSTVEGRAVISVALCGMSHLIDDQVEELSARAQLHRAEAHVALDLETHNKLNQRRVL